MNGKGWGPIKYLPDFMTVRVSAWAIAISADDANPLHTGSVGLPGLQITTAIICKSGTQGG